MQYPIYRSEPWNSGYSRMWRGVTAIEKDLGARKWLPLSLFSLNIRCPRNVTSEEYGNILFKHSIQHWRSNRFPITTHQRQSIIDNDPWCSFSRCSRRHLEFLVFISSIGTCLHLTFHIFQAVWFHLISSISAVVFWLVSISLFELLRRVPSGSVLGSMIAVAALPALSLYGHFISGLNEFVVVQDGEQSLNIGILVLQLNSNCMATVELGIFPLSLRWEYLWQ